jgi:protein-S-isoprenylcysteine O-methyltransferase Ste14
VTVGQTRTAIAITYGVGCHAAFGLAVGAMMVAMFYGMSRSLGTLPAPWSFVANGLLLIQFPVLHSWLLSRPGRSVVSRLAPFGLGDRLVTTTYALIASIQVALLFVLWSPSGTIWRQASGLVLVCIGCLYVTAWLLLLKSILDAGFALQVGLLGWWAVAKDAAPKYPPMPTSGLFRICRQPIYVSFALTLWTTPTLTPDQLVVALVLTAYCLIGPLFKEARFKRLFGDRFETYRRKTPYVPLWPLSAGSISRGKPAPSPSDSALPNI